MQHIGGRDKFPRKFGNPNQYIVHNARQYLYAIEKNEGRQSCYISVYMLKRGAPYGKERNHSTMTIGEMMKQLESREEPKKIVHSLTTAPLQIVIDKIYIDLDCGEKPQNALKDVQKIFDYLNKEGINKKPLVYFSGKKGFALYIHFPVVKLFDPKYVLKEWVKRLENALTLKTVDKPLRGEIHRISRIPFTRHVKTNPMCYCYPVIEREIYGSIEEIIEQSYNPPIREIKPDIFDNMPKTLIEIDNEPRITIHEPPRAESYPKAESYPGVETLGSYEWIEELLVIPCPDYRYPLTFELFMPFFVNVKKYPLAVITEKLKKWYALGGEWNEHNILDDTWIKSQYNTQKRKKYHYWNKKQFEEIYEIINNEIRKKKP